jgi:hypothetical protein
MTEIESPRVPVLALLAVLVIAFGTPAAARSQADDSCAERFPDQDWQLVVAGGGVTVFAAELASTVAARFAEDATEVVRLLRSDLGTFPDTTLCLFGAGTTLDASDLRDRGLLPPGQRLHAALFAEEALLYLDTLQFRLVPDAIALGFTHIALWELASAAGEAGYPEPLAGAIAQWYVARRNGRLESHRATMRVATFYGDPSGSAPAANWLSGAQEPVSVWNPEYQESPIGALIADAVATRGTDMLLRPDADEWAAAELAWRAELRAELLQGADESRDWIGGVLIAGGAVAAAIGFALWGRRQNRRPQTPVGDIARVEGFFDR